jgi:hypothetical protein
LRGEVHPLMGDAPKPHCAAFTSLRRIKLGRSTRPTGGNPQTPKSRDSSQGLTARANNPLVRKCAASSNF